MIRFVVGLFLFAVALCAYIVSLPQNDGRRPAQPIAIAPEAPSDPVADVTRAGGGDISAADALTAIAQASAPTDLGFMVSREPVAETISRVLVSLGLDKAAAGAAAPLTSLELLLMQSLRDRIGDQRIAQKVWDGAQAGAITVPDVLVTAGGGIDTPVLLTAILARASVVAGAAPDPALVPATGQTHTVVAGDSLAGLAVRYYGDIAQADMLLRVNSAVLGRADQIAVGQALVMPAL